MKKIVLLSIVLAAIGTYGCAPMGPATMASHENSGPVTRVADQYCLHGRPCTIDVFVWGGNIIVGADRIHIMEPTEIIWRLHGSAYEFRARDGDDESIVFKGTPLPPAGEFTGRRVVNGDYRIMNNFRTLSTYQYKVRLYKPNSSAPPLETDPAIFNDG